MRFNLKIAVVIVIAILLISSAYVIFYIFNENDNETDNEAPTIDTITGQTTGTAGKITTIEVTFSDNINVTVATLYYKSSTIEDWSKKSILNGGAEIELPSDSDEDWYYYITINDEAGNGPIGNPSIDGSTYYTITVSIPMEDLEHFVFIEEGTATWCVNCPKVAEILYDLYESGDYNFYYVAMIDDKNNEAANRMQNEYNLYGYPTVFIDGGYEVVVGEDEEGIKEAISKAEKRDAAKIQVSLSTEYDTSSKELNTEVLVKNKENEEYTGTLKVYLAEIISRWNTYDGKPYHHGFVGYIIDTEITISADDENTYSETWDVSDYDHENLLVVAAVFNSEAKPGDAYPDDPHPFDAYYADAADESIVVEGGNLPPEVGITFPEPGKLYFRSRSLLNFIYNKIGMHFNNTFVIGQITVTAFAQDDSGIEKVEFYIDDQLIETVVEKPYEISTRKFGTIKRMFIPQRHTLSVTAYDTTGKNSTASMDILTFFF